jgi:tRNA U34 5-methylaminomethyl-2-thiouridine-forming methyltransferase MnmC
MDVKLIITSDGSHSLLNTTLDETYHSRHGAIQESLHVFIRRGLDAWTGQNPGVPVNIFEVGFGTGLNALLTLVEADSRDLKVNYTSIEAYPISPELIASLNYPQLMFDSDAAADFAKLHGALWGTWTTITPDFRLNKIEGRLEGTNIEPSSYDLIYFDAFAPSKQPDMWEMRVLTKVVRTMNAGGMFVTYCAKGQLKRDLKNLGLEVETLPGPPGKKEMVRAIKHI